MNKIQQKDVLRDLIADSLSMKTSFDEILSADIFSDKERLVLNEKYRNGKTTADIGRMLNLSRQQISNIQKSALQKVSCIVIDHSIQIRTVKPYNIDRLAEIKVSDIEGLSLRCKNALYRYKIFDMRDVCEYLEKYNWDAALAFMHMRNVGKKSAEELILMAKKYCKGAA